MKPPSFLGDNASSSPPVVDYNNRYNQCQQYSEKKWLQQLKKITSTDVTKILYLQLIIPIVFVPKRRKPVLVKNVAQRLQEIIFELVKEHGWKLIALEIMPDHVHFFINAPTTESPSDIARWIKGRASHHLRQEFPELKKLPALWTPTYFVASTGQVSTEVVKKYIENQRGK